MHLIHPCCYFYASVPVVNVALRFQVVHPFVRPIFINMIAQEHNEGISLNMHKCPFGLEWTDFDSQRPNLKNSYTNNDISHKGLNTTKWWSDELRLNQNASKTWMYVRCDSVWFVDVLKDTSAGQLSWSMEDSALRKKSWFSVYALSLNRKTYWRRHGLAFWKPPGSLCIWWKRKLNKQAGQLFRIFLGDPF